jgi:hypothetical protein
VLLTPVPLLLAGVVTLEICVLIGLPLNFANIIALPVLLGIGVAFKIYYNHGLAVGTDRAAPIESDPGRDLQRYDDCDGVRKPLVVEPSGHVEHGQAVGPVTRLHTCGSRSLPTYPYGAASTIPRRCDETQSGSGQAHRCPSSKCMRFETDDLG